MSRKRDIIGELKLEKEAREYAEGIVATVREPLVVLDIDLRVIVVNKAFYKTFKVSPKETVGQFIYDLGNKQWNIPKLKQLLEDILPKNITFENFEVEHKFETIGLKTMLLNARRIPQPPAKPKIILLAFEDITKRRKKEQQLDQAILASIIDAVFVVDKNLKIVMFNRAAEKITGHRTAEVVGKNYHEILHFVSEKDDQTKELALHKIASNSQTKPMANHTLLILKDGKKIPVAESASLLKDNSGDILGFVIVFRDVSKDRQMRERLKESEIKFKTIFEDSRDGMLIANAETKKFGMCNRAICKMLGYTEKELLNLKVDDIHPKKDLPFVKKIFEQQAKRAIKLASSLPVERKDGSVFFADVNTSPLLINGEGFLMGNFRDITEKKEIEQAKNDFLNIAAHDLRTPMSEIRANTEMILNGDYGQIPPKFKTPLRDIDKANLNLVKMIDDFLTISRIEKGKITINPQPTDILPILNFIAKQDKPLIEKIGLRFNCEIPAKLPQVLVDADKISEVINNLLDNAMKFTDKGSISLKVLVEKDSIVIQVADTGVGIAKERLKDLFQKYVQVGKEKRIVHGKGTGLGLGLYISRLIIEGCKGKIWVDSELDKGSTFCFSLAIAKNNKTKI